jgi:hypothetical protein
MQEVILALHVGELGWELLRFAPYVLWYKTKNPDCKLIVQTRVDRFDLYGKYCDQFVPLILDDNYIQNCFGLTGLKNNEYNNLIKSLNEKFYQNYSIKKCIYPVIEGKQFTRKDQFKLNEMIYDFKPRDNNFLVCDKFITSSKPLVVLAPRYRKNVYRNWNQWDSFYDMIYEDSFLRQFDFVICGKHPDYVVDKKGRFYDINDISQSEDISLIGITIAILKRAILTVGTQSSIPNLSNLVGTSTLQWGHQQHQHEKVYNVKKTKTHFITTGETKKTYDNVSYNQVFDAMKQILKKEI